MLRMYEADWSPRNSHLRTRRGYLRPPLPLGAARALLSIAASQGKNRPGHHQVMLLDVKKAFLYGNIQRRVYIELPQEDEKREGGQMMGLLNKAMYGLRDAPQVWQQEVRRILKGMGFIESVTSPCVYVNPQTSVRIVTHVDDFLCVGPRSALDEFYGELSKVLDLTCNILGPSPGDGKVGQFLGRKIKWHNWGISWQGDNEV